MFIKKEKNSSWKDSWAHLGYCSQRDATVELLLNSKKADPNCQADMPLETDTWKLGDTPLLYVLRLTTSTNGNKGKHLFPDCLLLLEAGADPYIKNTSGESAMDFIQGREDCLLIKNMFENYKQIQQDTQNKKFLIYDWIKFFCYNQIVPMIPTENALLTVPKGEKKTVYQILKEEQITPLFPRDDFMMNVLNSEIQNIEKKLNDKPKVSMLRRLKQSSCEAKKRISKNLKEKREPKMLRPSHKRRVLNKTKVR